jgi:protocatechuate 3,4-dioxygenase beta subunit
VRSRFGKDYVVVMIDTDRMTGGADLARELRRGRGGGIPWMVILDAAGAPRVTSDGPEGNCGCPAKPQEIDHFMAMVDQTRRHMSADDRVILERELRAYGAGLIGPRRKVAGARAWADAVGKVRFGRFTAAVERLGAAMVEGHPAAALLYEPALRPLREDPDRRLELMELVKRHVATDKLALVDCNEPGERIRLQGRIVDKATGAPLGGALLQLFHTDAAGEYRPGMDSGGGAGNPRLWGFLRTDADGRFTVDTIMPERYPNSTVPRHVHYRVWAEGYPKFDSECFFAADPNLDESTRKSAPSRNLPIVEVRRDDQRRATATLIVRVPGKQ